MMWGRAERALTTQICRLGYAAGMSSLLERTTLAGITVALFLIRPAKWLGHGVILLYAGNLLFNLDGIEAKLFIALTWVGAHVVWQIVILLIAALPTTMVMLLASRRTRP